MGHMYYTRHGQTVWNVENKICGSTDVSLTEKGINQAKELGEKILESGIRIDKIISSPLERAAETARYVSEITNIPMEIEPRLMEQNFGRFESTARNGEEFKYAKANFIYDFDGGETMLHLCQRIYNLIDDIKKDEENVYLLVAHNGIARVIESYFRNMGNQEFADYGIRNCEIKKYEF